MGHPTRRSALVAVVLASAAGCGALDSELGAVNDDLAGPRINQLQAIGTHNSYHMASDGAWSDWPGAYSYFFPPLDVQLDELGVRHLELDVHLEDDHFAVYHMGGDPGTTCPSLRDCLERVTGWSDGHRGHHPIFIMIEAKDGEDGLPPGPDSSAWYATLEREIGAVVPPERLLTPALVRGDAADLWPAIVERGWPTIAATRGMIAFYVPRAADAPRSNTFFYWTKREPDDDTVVLVPDEPRGHEDEIRAQVAAGLLVRTRADKDVAESIDLDYGRFDAAIRSGAQLISTDFPTGGFAPRGFEIGFLDDYRDEVPSLEGQPRGTPSRCDPVTADPACRPEDIEDL